MKKIIVLIFIIFIFVSNTYAYVNTYQITTSDKIIINKLSNKINKLLSKNTLSFRIKLETKINNIQYKYKKNKRIYTIFKEIKINTNLINYKNEYEKHYKIFNIDINKVKKQWLKWHNDVRYKL